MSAFAGQLGLRVIAVADVRPDAAGAGSMPASRSSCSVRASALEKPGIDATGAKYSSSSAVTASNTARAAIASAPACVPGRAVTPAS